MDQGSQPLKFLKFADVVKRTSISRAELYRRVEAGTFPRPVPLGGARVGFVEAEVDRWMVDRLATRDAKLTGGAAHA